MTFDEPVRFSYWGTQYSSALGLWMVLLNYFSNHGKILDLPIPSPPHLSRNSSYLLRPHVTAGRRLRQSRDMARKISYDHSIRPKRYLFVYSDLLSLVPSLRRLSPTHKAAIGFQTMTIYLIIQ